jgi:CheY-like chemotaxis protein
MDHLMPDMDGEQVLERIPARHPHVIVMLSGTLFKAEDRERIRGKGVSAFFEKPLDWQGFDAALIDLFVLRLIN